MAFNNPSSKLERALRALMTIQGAGTPADSFVSNDSRQRTLPNRTYLVTTFTPSSPYRLDGICHIQIQHHFDAVDQSNQDSGAQQAAMDVFLGDTMDTLLGLDQGKELTALAAAITGAGRDLAIPNPSLTGDEATADAALAARHADMADFRCDWMKLSTPLLTRGQDSNSTNWVEIISLEAFVSTATTNN